MRNTVETSRTNALRDALHAQNSGLVRVNEPLSRRTTYRVGGFAETLYTPFTFDDVRHAVLMANELSIPLHVLGGGSNVLIADGMLRGLTLDMASSLNEMKITGLKVVAQAGVKLLHLVRASTRAGLQGIELLGGIPGTVGGGTWMNCGAYGMEISNCVTSLLTIDRQGIQRELKASDVTWGYRSVPELRDQIILSVDFEFQSSDPVALTDALRNTLAKRRASQPLTYPSAGSVFKRPPNQFAGALIEQAGLKGYRMGGAEVSSKHAGFIINKAHATACDIHGLMKHVKAEVKRQSGIELQLEQRLWGFEHAEI